MTAVFQRLKFFGDERTVKRGKLSSAGPIQASGDPWLQYQITVFFDGWLDWVWLAVTVGTYLIQAMYNRSVYTDLWRQAALRHFR